VYAGYTVPVFYDPMLSKLIAHAMTREEAIARMKRALTEYRVEGIMTTIPFFTLIMNNPDYRDAENAADRDRPDEPMERLKQRMEKFPNPFLFAERFRPDRRRGRRGTL